MLHSTPIPGLVVLDLDPHGDSRGWFLEAWQRERMVAAGLPDFGPVQHNVSYNEQRGVTRGLHAEPWDKFVTVLAGRAFAAWVDLRPGEGYGATHTVELEPGRAVFVPRGVANGYQTLTPGVVYSYLVNQHWRPDARYVAVALDDPAVGIAWPIPLDEAIVSDKDRANPALADAGEMAQPESRVLILGGHGMLGQALAVAYPDADLIDLVHLDLTDPAALATLPWSSYDVVVNAAAYTAVDAAESEEGRRASWAVNAVLPTRLAILARDHDFTLVHFSTDYVFDGTRSHDENESPSPLGVYGQSKAAGELAASTAPKHYVLRTSWLVGNGPNFVRTMADLAAKGVSPSVVDDQIGRLTFVGELVRATAHLIDSGSPHGIYQVSNGGRPRSWADWAKEVFRLSGRDPDDVTPISTSEYETGRTSAPRPLNGILSLDKIEATGFTPEDADTALQNYLKGGV